METGSTILSILEYFFVLELMWHLYSMPVMGSNVVLVASDVMEKIHMLTTCDCVRDDPLRPVINALIILND